MFKWEVFFPGTAAKFATEGRRSHFHPENRSEISQVETRSQKRSSINPLAIFGLYGLDAWGYNKVFKRLLQSKYWLWWLAKHLLESTTSLFLLFVLCGL